MSFLNKQKHNVGNNKPNTIRYIFEHRKPELRRLVVKYGLAPAKDEKDLWMKVNYLLVKFTNEMLKDVADIHPDKDLIVWSESRNNKGEHEPKKESKGGDGEISHGDISKRLDDFFNKKEKKSGACGCSGADGNFSNLTNESLLECGGNYSNCAGNPNCPCSKGKGESNFSSANATPAVAPVAPVAPAPVKNHTPLIAITALLAVGAYLYFKH